MNIIICVVKSHNVEIFHILLVNRLKQKARGCKPFIFWYFSVSFSHFFFKFLSYREPRLVVEPTTMLKLFWNRTGQPVEVERTAFIAFIEKEQVLAEIYIFSRVYTSSPNHYNSSLTSYAFVMTQLQRCRCLNLNMNTGSWGVSSGNVMQDDNTFTFIGCKLASKLLR